MANNEYTAGAETEAPNADASLHRILAAADYHFQSGDLGSARDFMELASQIKPQSIPILSTLGSLEYQLGHFDAAARDFTRAKALNAHDASVLTQLAATWLKLGHLDAFETSIDDALAADPTFLDAFRLRAKHYLESKRYLEAARWYNRILRLEPFSQAIYLALGKCFYELGDFETARTVYNRVIELDGSCTAAFEALAIIDTVAPCSPDPRTVRYEMSFAA